MDWAKQSEEMLKNWSETQQAMWKNWTDMFPGAGAAPQTTELWAKTVETWEQALHSSMEAQAEWMRMWVESLESQDQLPDEMVTWAEQVQEMSRQWGVSQARRRPESLPGLAGLGQEGDGRQHEAGRKLDCLWHNRQRQVTRANHGKQRTESKR